MFDLQSWRARARAEHTFAVGSGVGTTLTHWLAVANLGMGQTARHYPHRLKGLPDPSRSTLLRRRVSLWPNTPLSRHKMRSPPCPSIRWHGAISFNANKPAARLLGAQTHGRADGLARLHPRLYNWKCLLGSIEQINKFKVRRLLNGGLAHLFFSLSVHMHSNTCTQTLGGKGVCRGKSFVSGFRAKVTRAIFLAARAQCQQRCVCVCVRVSVCVSVSAPVKIVPEIRGNNCGAEVFKAEWQC